MKKIIIQAAGAQEADRLVRCLNLLFPECDIHVHRGDSKIEARPEDAGYGIGTKNTEETENCSRT
ncbi:MAG: hypothetical protein K9M96_10065 [Deltaproteobacteria bacterium]|nr:hypothetical protein [Deltaproteobacteria bacterium]